MQAIGPKMKAQDHQQAMRDAHFLVGPYHLAAPSAANRYNYLTGKRERCQLSSEPACGPSGSLLHPRPDCVVPFYRNQLLRHALRLQACEGAGHQRVHGYVQLDTGGSVSGNAVRRDAGSDHRAGHIRRRRLARQVQQLRCEDAAGGLRHMRRDMLYLRDRAVVRVHVPGRRGRTRDPEGRRVGHGSRNPYLVAVVMDRLLFSPALAYVEFMASPCISAMSKNTIIRYGATHRDSSAYTIYFDRIYPQLPKMHALHSSAVEIEGVSTLTFSTSRLSWGLTRAGQSQQVSW